MLQSMHLAGNLFQISMTEVQCYRARMLTAALLAVAFFTTKKLHCLAQTVVLSIADSVLLACGPQTSKLQTTWVAGPRNPGFRGLPKVPGVPRGNNVAPRGNNVAQGTELKRNIARARVL